MAHPGCHQYLRTTPVSKEKVHKYIFKQKVLTLSLSEQTFFSLLRTFLPPKVSLSSGLSISVSVISLTNTIALIASSEQLKKGDHENYFWLSSSHKLSPLMIAQSFSWSPRPLKNSTKSSSLMSSENFTTDVAGITTKIHYK